MVLASALGYVLAAVVIFGLLIALITGLASTAKPKANLPSEGVLNLKLNYAISDKIDESNPLIALKALDPNAKMPVGLNRILRSIEKAKTDERIKGIILDLTTLQTGYAKLTEIRTKLEEFKESGKFIYGYADYFYYPTYFLASVADSVFVNPEGEMAFTGMVAEVGFFANTLEKMGVEMQVVRAGKFKGAVEPYIRESLSVENREQIQTYINSVFKETLNKISASRNIDIETLKKDADELEIRSVSDFVKNNYLDATLYKDQFYSTMKRRMGVSNDTKVSLISIQKYAKNLGSYGSGSDRVAVVYASGEIVGGRGDGSQIAAEDMAATLKKVREDDRIKAVVFRIDSRGGSSLASEIIWREAKLLAEEKPLITSMSDVAASGGYYIATPSHKILAEPTTITGSIGVFGLIPNAQKLLNNKLGINFDYVGTGKHSDIGRIDRNMTADERAYIEEIIDRIYSTFLSRVSEGRNMTTEEVHEIAQGRVWTGVMAREVGLVDELGGLHKAIKLAAEQAHLSEYKVKEYPKAQDPINAIVNKMTGNASLKSQIASLSKSTAFGKYVESLSDLDKWGTKHTVQALMPYNIEVKNYFLR